MSELELTRGRRKAFGSPPARAVSSPPIPITQVGTLAGPGSQAKQDEGGKSQSRITGVSVKQLERLKGVFEGSVFDTSGPNGDVLKLLLTACKALVAHSIDHAKQLDAVSGKLHFVDSVSEQVEASTRATTALEEATKRVNFLWAAQGLSDFALDQSASHHSITRGTPQKLRQQSDPQSSKPYSLENVDVDMQAAELLRKSYENIAMADERIRSFEARAQSSELEERVMMLERVVEGVHGASCKLQAQVVRLNEMCDNLSHDASTLEQRITFNVDAVRRVEDSTGRIVDDVGKSIDGLARRLATFHDELAEHRNVAVSTSTQIDSIKANVATVEREKASPGDVKAAVSAALAASMRPLTSSVDCLFRLLDLPPDEALELASSATSVDVSAAVRDDTAVIAEQAKARLRLVHSGVPFRTILSALRLLGDTVNSLQDKLEVLGATTERGSQPPLLGVELVDENDGVRVTRVFEDLAAKRAGVKEGDVILAADQRKVTSREQFGIAMAEAVAKSKPSIVLHLLRGGQNVVNVTLTLRG